MIIGRGGGGGNRNEEMEEKGGPGTGYIENPRGRHDPFGSVYGWIINQSTTTTILLQCVLNTPLASLASDSLWPPDSNYNSGDYGPSCCMYAHVLVLQVIDSIKDGVKNSFKI